MRFIDEAVIEVAAGDGGRGLVSFRREAMMPRGGPDGGHGGKGGDVVVVADPGCLTLLDHRYRRSYKAEAGDPGGPNDRTGRSGEDLVIPLPVGTVVTDEESAEVLADLTAPGERVVLAHGGRGGRGNASFATPTRQAPRHAAPGVPGERRRLLLSLKLVADVGLLGLPNAGKSTFIRAITRSQAKVADYPFTTLVPNLGVARIDGRDLVLADIPGLVPGAHEGAGLGDRFLKHVDRTRALVHLVSLSPDAPPPFEAYESIQAELRAWSPHLAERPQVVVLNKVDLLGDGAEVSRHVADFAARGVEVLAASGLTGENTDLVLRRVADLVFAEKAAETPAPEGWSPV
jgi:GTP-binding protein